jgi:hypothetical protein
MLPRNIQNPVASNDLARVMLQKRRQLCGDIPGIGEMRVPTFRR